MIVILLSVDLFSICMLILEQFSIERRKQSGIALVLLYYALWYWFKNLAPPTQPIRSKTITNRDLVAGVFPRLAPGTCICFKFSLVHCVVYVCCDWLVVIALGLVLRHSIENRSNQHWRLGWIFSCVSSSRVASNEGLKYYMGAFYLIRSTSRTTIIKWDDIFWSNRATRVELLLAFPQSPSSVKIGL